MTKRTLQDVASGETQFVPSGTLPEPGPMGRFIRLLFGLAILFLILPGLFQSLPTLADVVEFPTNLLFWVIVALTFVNMSHVINLGLGKSWGHKPEAVFLGLMVAALLWSLLGYGRVWAPLFLICLFYGSFLSICRWASLFFWQPFYARLAVKCVATIISLPKSEAKTQPNIFALAALILRIVGRQVCNKNRRSSPRTNSPASASPQFNGVPSRHGRPP